MDDLQINLYFKAFFNLLITPFTILLSVYIYFSFAGPKAIVGVVFAFIQLIVSLIFGKIYGSLQYRFMNAKDVRMRGLDEMMYGIKTIKYNSFENFFQ